MSSFPPKSNPAQVPSSSAGQNGTTEGSPIDWLAAFDLHRDRLQHFLISKMSGLGASSVDDVFQEVALAVHKADNRPGDPEKILPWLMQVARHKVQDFWRKMERQQKLETRVESSLTQDGGQSPSPFDWILQIEKKEEVHRALASLPSDDRELLEQKYLEGKKYRDLADAQGISVKAIEYRLLQARQSLRTHLQP